MALTAPTATVAQFGDLVTSYSRRSTLDFNRMSLLRRLADDRSSEVSASYQVLISDPQATTTGDDTTKYGMATTTVRNAAYDRSDDSWPAGQEVESEFITMPVNRVVKGAADLKYLDMVEAPLNYLERQRAKMAAVMAVDLEDDYYGFLSGLAYGTRSATLGDAGSDFIAPPDASGKAAKTGWTDFGMDLYDAIMDFNTYLVRNSIKGPAAGVTIGGSAGMPYVAMNPQIFQHFLKWFLDKRLSWDTLTADILQNNSLLARSEYRGSLAGIPIFSTPALTEPTASTMWRVQCGTTMANSVATRPLITQFLTPEVNQAKYRYTIKQVQFHGRVEVNPELNYEIKIRVK